MPEIIVTQTYNDGTQLESDGVVRTRCTANGDNKTTCDFPGCKDSRQEQARQIRQKSGITTLTDKDPNTVDDYTEINKNIKVFEEKILSAKGRIEMAQSDLDYCEQRLKLWKDRKEDLTKKKQEQAAREAKAKEAKRQKATQTITEQIQSLSQERLIELLVEQGVEQIGPKQDSPRLILSEAFETLKMSYWIKNNEQNWADGIFKSPFEIPEGVKGLPVKVEIDPYAEDKTPKYRLVTGVCSVGALALSRAMLDDEPIQAWNTLMDTDRSAHIAAAALAWSIIERLDPDVEGVTMTTRLTNVITHWNDNETRERDDVLDTWEFALQAPVLDIPEDQESLYFISTPYTRLTSYPFASEAAAQEVINKIKSGAELTTGEMKIKDYYNDTVELHVVSTDLPAPRVALV